MFFSKKSLENQLKILFNDFDGMAKEISLIAGKIANVDFEIAKFRSELLSLRGLVNRKLSKEAGEIEKETSKSIDGLDDLRKI